MSGKLHLCHFVDGPGGGISRKMNIETTENGVMEMPTNRMDGDAVHEIEEEICLKECELHRHYSQLGKSLLEMAEVEQRIINCLVDEIIAARIKLVQVKGQLECPQCTAYNDSDSRFCKHCGARLGAAIDKEEDNETNNKTGTG